MMLIFKSHRCALLLTILSSAVAWGPRARAQDEDAVQKVVELNKKALAAYANLDMEEAANLLKQAIGLCASQKLEQHPMAARTHVHLGVVCIAGLKQRDQGIEEFKKALRIDPKIKVTKSMVNPEVQAAFQEAAMDVPGVATEAAGTPAAVTPSEPAQPVRPERSARSATPTQPTGPAGSAMVHAPVTEGAAGQPITVKVQVPASLGAERVALAYRGEGASDYLTREMDPAESSHLYQGQIPPEATGGGSVLYYILAQDARGQIVAQDGTAADPHRVNLAGGGGIISGGSPETATAEEEEGRGPSFWATVAVGSGFGYHSGTPEANRTDDSGKKLKSSGFALSQLLQISPEIGYFHSDSVVFSLQGRLQFVSGATAVKGSEVVGNTGACKGGTCHPASYALAVMAKVTWFLGEPGRVNPFISLAVGAGQIRQIVSVGKLSGCPSSGCKDTVVGGPVLFGPGAGVSIELSDSFSLLASTNAFVGVPKVMANLDVNLGFAYIR